MAQKWIKKNWRFLLIFAVFVKIRLKTYQLWPHNQSSQFLLLGSGPEGADDLCFHAGEIFPSPSSPSPPSTPSNLKSSLKAQNLASRLNYQPWSSNSSLEAQIPASNLKFQPQSLESSLKAQNWASKPRIQPQGSKSGHAAPIPASRLNSSLQAQPPASKLKFQPPSSNFSLNA